MGVFLLNTHRLVLILYGLVHRKPKVQSDNKQAPKCYPSRYSRKPTGGELMNYETSTHQHNLLHDLADNITNFQALDQAVAVLIEWGFIEADFGAEYIKEIEGGN